MNPAETVAKNLQALQIAFQIIQSLIQEYQKEGWRAVGYCDAFTLSAANQIIAQRFEIERRKLPPTAQSTIQAPTPPPLPTIPQGRSKEVAEAIGDSAFFKTVWPNIKRG